MSDDFKITLTREEALVLFDWLADSEGSGTAPLDAAQQTVLWKIEDVLESALTEVVLPDYADKVAAAKQEILRGTLPPMAGLGVGERWQRPVVAITTPRLPSATPSTADPSAPVG